MRRTSTLGVSPSALAQSRMMSAGCRPAASGNPAAAASDQVRSAAECPSTPDQVRSAAECPSTPDQVRSAAECPSTPDQVRSAAECPSTPDQVRSAAECPSTPDALATTNGHRARGGKGVVGGGRARTLEHLVHVVVGALHRQQAHVVEVLLHVVLVVLVTRLCADDPCSRARPPPQSTAALACRT
jgi:hypothetical protein